VSLTTTEVYFFSLTIVENFKIVNMVKLKKQEFILFEILVLFTCCCCALYYLLVDSDVVVGRRLVGTSAFRNNIS